MNEDKLEELNAILKNPDYLDLDSQKAIQIAERFFKNKYKFKKPLKTIKLALLSNTFFLFNSFHLRLTIK